MIFANCQVCLSPPPPPFPPTLRDNSAHSVPTSPDNPTFAGENFNVTEMLISLFYRVKNIVGKGENAGYHFLLSHNVFESRLFQGR